MRVKWDEVGERLYETGVKMGMLYNFDNDAKAYNSGVAWNGLTGVTETPSGADVTDLYADDIKYLSMRSAETYGGTITAYMYPDEFRKCNGEAEPVDGVVIGMQSREMFGMSYRTTLGNDTQLNDYGYLLHLSYGMTVSPSERAYATINDSPDAIEFSWEFTTTPVNVTGYKPTALITINSKKADATKLAQLENILYGSDGTASYDAVTPVGTENPHTEGWYERSGSSGSYVYTLTADTTVDSGKTYYAKTTTGATSPRLPMPDEVFSTLRVTTGG